MKEWEQTRRRRRNRFHQMKKATNPCEGPATEVATVVAAPSVAKGSRIHQWKRPFLVLPLLHSYDYDSTISAEQVLTTTAGGSTSLKPHPRKRRRSSAAHCHQPGLDDPSIRYWRQLPQWDDCPIFHHLSGFNANESSALCSDDSSLQPFLKRLHRRVLADDDCYDHNEHEYDGKQRSASEIDRPTFRELCILALLKVVTIHVQANNNGNSQDWWQDLPELGDPDSSNNATLHRTIDDDPLLVELWPLMRHHIPWRACRHLYQIIQTNLHVLSVPHPLQTYVRDVLFRLDQNEFDRCWELLTTGQNTSATAATVFVTRHDAIDPHNRRLYASQLLLDKVAALPERWVGVLLNDPTRQNNTQDAFHCITQSCLPNVCLELVVSSENSDHENHTVNEPNSISCDLIALYDLSCGNDGTKPQWTLSTQPKSRCSCFRCSYEAKRTHNANETIMQQDILRAQRLAHFYFQNDNFDKAFDLYQACHDGLPAATKEKADCWHSMAAVLLAQRKFAKAQRLWKQGQHYSHVHREIALQCEKQEAYGYFHTRPAGAAAASDAKSSLPSYERILPLPASSLLSSLSSSMSRKEVFVAPSVVDCSTCRALIQWAQDYAAQNGGWTTSRHYAVPTTDLPVHQVPHLLEWFQDWTNDTLFPLLQDQFHVNQKGTTSRFYVHDAFLVRYEATGSNNFLPLHYDESTHSCVLALNYCSSIEEGETAIGEGTFTAGGTFFFDLGRSICPPQGGLVSFRGNQCLHGGNPVNGGVRYILAMFLYLDEDLAATDPSFNDNEEQQKESDTTKDETTGFSFGFF